jgi:hypothetical protein
MNRKLILVLVMPLMMLSTSVRAQADLGTQATERTFSADYQKAIDTAFPRYENEALQKRFDALRLKYSTGRDTLQIWKLDQLESVLALPRTTIQPTQSRVTLPEREYGIDQARGRVFLLQKPTATAPISAARLQQIKPQITAYHEDVLKRIGIPSDEIFYKRTDVIVGQGSTAPGQREAQKSEPVVHGVQTYALRAVEGIQIEGGSVRLVSTDTGRLDLLDARWAPFALAPQTAPMLLRNRDQIRDSIAAKVKELARGAKVSIKMAVVMRQVQSDKQGYFAPAMKVGLRTEGEGEGAIFYEPLSNQPLVEDQGRSDTASGGEAK